MIWDARAKYSGMAIGNLSQAQRFQAKSLWTRVLALVTWVQEPSTQAWMLGSSRGTKVPITTATYVSLRVRLGGSSTQMHVT